MARVRLPPAPSAITGSLLVLVAALPGAGQEHIGPSKCTSCHDHERQTEQWQRAEPAASGGKAHVNALKRLDEDRALRWARAVGLSDSYDLDGSCVRCHATVYRGDANAGVSCESCHGPASVYLEPHQVKGSYATAVTQGMRDTRDAPEAIARLCVECHVVTDARLVATGHPSGATFDAGMGLRKLVHWTRAYDYGRITALARPAAPAPAAAPATRTAAPSPTRPAAPPPTAPAAAEPWDWDQPVRALPADYVPEPISPELEHEVAEAVAAPTPVPRQVAPPSLAEEAPLLGHLPGAGPSSGSLMPAVAPAPAPRPASPAAARAASGEPSASPSPASGAQRVVQLRGEALALLVELLRGGARVPELPAPARPAAYRGPDGELLRLQDEVLTLALEALRRPGP